MSKDDACMYCMCTSVCWGVNHTHRYLLTCTCLWDYIMRLFVGGWRPQAVSVLTEGNIDRFS